MKIKIIPIRTDFLMKVRNANLDDQNQKVARMKAKGGEPCRDVLRGAKVGEELILASYCPFSVAGPYKEYGPVFVLANPSAEPVNWSELPLPKDLPTDYLGSRFVLRAYSRDEWVVRAELVTPQNVGEILENMLRQDAVAFVLARFAAAGCYGFRIEADV